MLYNMNTNLKRGDLSRIAKALGVTRQCVNAYIWKPSKVVQGRAKIARELVALSEIDYPAFEARLAELEKGASHE